MNYWDKTIQICQYAISLLENKDICSLKPEKNEAYKIKIIK